MSDTYILKDDHSVKKTETMEWALWFNTANRTVLKDNVCGFLISTVFLGLDHSFGGDKPQIFETMVFDDTSEERQCEHYTTWDDAVAGHNRMVALIKERTK